MPYLNFAISLEEGAKLFGATEVKAFEQGRLISIYRALSDDKCGGLCAGLVYTWTCYQALSPFAFLDELDNTVKTLERDFIDLSSVLTDAHRVELEHLEKSVKVILANQERVGPASIHWENLSSTSPLYCLGRSDDCQIGEHAKIIQQLKIALLSAIGGYISVGYPDGVISPEKGGQTGRLVFHNIGLRCFLHEGKLNFLYFDPNEGMALWDDPTKFFNFLEARLRGIISRVDSAGFDRKLDLYSKMLLAIGGKRVVISTYSKDKAPWSLVRGEKIQAILRDDTQKAILDTFYSEMSFKFYVELYSKNKELMKQILSELPQCRKMLTDKFIFRSISPDEEVSEYIKTISSVDDCQAFIELLLLVEGAQIGAFLDAFEGEPKILGYIFQEERVLEKISSQKELKLENPTVRDAFADCAVTYPVLRKVAVISSIEKLSIGKLADILQKIPPEFPPVLSSTETASSFLKKRFGKPVEPSTPMLAIFGLFSLATVTAVALGVAAHGISRMRTSG